MHSDFSPVEPGPMRTRGRMDRAGKASHRAHLSDHRREGVGSPYGAANYCVNASIQFYDANLDPLGHNIRLTQPTWDPQLYAATWVCSCDLNDTFIGDYYGNTISGSTDYSSFVSTFDDGTNPAHHQQQVVATVPAP